jgi:hypothetical protein
MVNAADWRWKMKSHPLRLVLLSYLLLAFAGSEAFATDDGDDWQHALTLYGWLPSVSGDLKYGQGDSSSVDSSDVLDALNMTFMGAYELRKHNWYLLTDVIYLDLGNSADTRVTLPGGGHIVSNVQQDLVGWQFGIYGGYLLHESARSQVSLLAGLRYLSIDADARLTIDGPLPPQLPSRHLSRSTDLWDGIVGARGRIAINDQWFIPFHLDVGTGDSDLTWQAASGVGYRASWGEVSLQYRHLEWDQVDDGLLQSLGFSGPGLAVKFRF